MWIDGEKVRFAPNVQALIFLVMIIICPFVGAWKLALFLFLFFVLPTVLHIGYLAARGRVSIRREMPNGT